MSKAIRSRAFLVAATILVGSGAGVGCRSEQSRLDFVSYEDPAFPQTYHTRFDDVAYRHDKDGDMHVAAYAAGASGKAAAQAVEQLVHLHLFWNPRPGVTFSDSSTTTATIQYVITTQRGSATYTGTGFAYPRQRGEGTVLLEVENARLKLSSQTGEPPGLIGAARVTGTLIAERNPYRVVDLLREFELRTATPQPQE